MWLHLRTLNRREEATTMDRGLVEAAADVPAIGDESGGVEICQGLHRSCNGRLKEHGSTQIPNLRKQLKKAVNFTAGDGLADAPVTVTRTYIAEKLYQ